MADFLVGGMILGSPLSCPNLFLYTITLSTGSRDVPPTLSYATLEMVSRVLLSSSGRFLSGGMILGSSLSWPDLFLYTITVFAAGREAPLTFSYTPIEMA